MDAMEAILGRRSIRQYTESPVSDETVETILRAAMAAPSANDKQPWRFIIINKREILDAIPAFHQYAAMLKQAPLAILICGDKSAVSHTGYLYLDCSAATQNMLLAIHALGLGAVWLGIYPREQRMAGIRDLLGLPDHLEPVALVSIGYPAEHKPPSRRFDKEKIRYNHW